MSTKKIHFRKESSSGFYSILKQRVFEFINNHEKRISYFPAVKTMLLSLLYAFSLTSVFVNPNVPVILLSYVILGALTTGIVLNIVHDAVHNALFKNPLWNKIAILWMEVLGTDAYIWKRRHITFHHSYPNIIGMDSDIRQSNLIRILPNAPYLSQHRYQHYYMPFVYFFFTLNWFFSRDFNDAFFHSDELHIRNGRKAKLIIQKIVYLFCFIILPALVTGNGVGIYIAGFLLMHFTASIIGVFALTTSHVNQDSIFPEPDENGMMPDSWATHQLKVTQDFGTNNFFINTCFGGFNFHVAHHLFPSLQHRYYKKITEIIRITAEEFGMEYKCKPFGAALLSHYKLLISNSRHPVEIDL